MRAAVPIHVTNVSLGPTGVTVGLERKPGDKEAPTDLLGSCATGIRFQR